MRNMPAKGVSPAKMRILLFLTQNGSSPMKDIRDELKTTATNVTGLVDGLEKDDFVERVQSKADRRITLIKITENGRTLSLKKWNEYETRVSSVFDALLPDEQEKFLEYIEKLLHRLEENRNIK